MLGKNRHIYTTVKIHGKEVHISVNYTDVAVFSNATKELAVGLGKYANLATEVLGQLDKKEAPTATIPHLDGMILHLCVSAAKKVLTDNPSFITADHFSLSIAVGPRIIPRALLGIYKSALSSPAAALIKINLDTLQAQILDTIGNAITRNPKLGIHFQEMVEQAGVYMLEQLLLHELYHHKELDLHANEVRAMRHLIKNKVPAPMIIITILAAKVRTEAVATFQEVMGRTGKRIKHEDISFFMKALDDLDSVPESWLIKMFTAVPYELGVLMCCIILLDYGKKRCDAKGRQMLNKAADQINSLLSQGKDIDLSPTAPQVVREVANHISSMNTEQFMIAYERACKRLGISRKNRLLTWTNYRKAVGKAQKKYLKLMEENGFEVEAAYDAILGFMTQTLNAKQ